MAHYVYYLLLLLYYVVVFIDYIEALNDFRFFVLYKLIFIFIYFNFLIFNFI